MVRCIKVLCRNRRNIFSSFLIIVLMFVHSFYAFAETARWDGYDTQNVSLPNEISLIDFNNPQEIISAGAQPSNKYNRDGLYSAYWSQSASKELIFTNVPKDWTDYDFLDLWIYAENADYTRFLTGPVCYPLPGESENGSYFYTYTEVRDGWNHFTYNLKNLNVSRSASYDRIKNLRFTVGGWNLTVNKDAKYYIASAKLKRLNIYESLKENYTIDVLNETVALLENAVAVYGESPNVVINGKVETYDGMSHAQKSKTINGSVMVPVTFFEKFLGCRVSESGSQITIGLDQQNITLTENEKRCQTQDGDRDLQEAPQRMDDTFYVPVGEVASILGKQVLQVGHLVIIGEDQSIYRFITDEKLNDLGEVVQYLAAYVDIDPETIGEEEFVKAKNKWRYFLVADESLDVNDPYIAKKLSTIQAMGQSAWNTLNKGEGITELFDGIESVSSASLTSQYQRLRNMALAYGTYGNGLYKNEALKNDILYALEWLYQNRYGQNEINGTGWRDPSDYNWWDWKIGVPEKLIDILMIMEEELTQQQIKNYLALFDYLVPKTYSTGANRIDMGKAIIGSGLLQKDAKKVIEARNALDSIFLYADNGRNNKQGFYTDGSYIYHGAHPMNGTYGVEQLEQTGVLLSILKGTAFEYTNPQVSNVRDWYYNAYEPLMYQGSIMKMVRGRNNPPGERSTGVRVLSYMIDMLDALDEADKARFKSIIKRQVIDDTLTDYYSTLSLVRTQKLKEIMNDESVQPRENYLLNKVYYNMDKVVHHREDFAVGISMSSSRIYAYESINGQNATGWYSSDGMMTVYVKDALEQYSDTYWKYIDPYRLPGITVDTQERPAVNIATGNEWLSSQDFVGGVTIDGTYGTAAMSLESYHSDVEIGQDRGSYGGPSPIHHCSLMAKKAWFMFDDEVVALGTDINAHDDVNVLTIVDNRLSFKTRSLKSQKYTGKKYQVVNVFASQEPEPENAAVNTIDEQMSTKWAAEGEADITWDLGEVKKCGFINLAFINGDKRQQIFDLYTSVDGMEWVLRFSGMSSGKTEGIETYDLGNCEARYIRLNSHGTTTTSQWISLATAEIYPPYEGELPTMEEPEYIGTERIDVEGVPNIEIGVSDVSLKDKKWVHLEGVGGYYFPQGGNLFARRTSGIASFFELWFDHGVNPEDGSYCYVVLPGKSTEQTEAYAQNADVEILSNTKEIQAVREKNLGITGIVFWEAGTFNGITVSEPMIVMLKETEDGIQLAVSDPTHKLNKGTVTIHKELQYVSGDKRIKVAEGVSTVLTVDFAGSSGRSLEVQLHDLKKNSEIYDGIHIRGWDTGARSTVR